jgi:hypothetical protein
MMSEIVWVVIKLSYLSEDVLWISYSILRDGILLDSHFCYLRQGLHCTVTTSLANSHFIHIFE